MCPKHDVFSYRFSSLNRTIVGLKSHAALSVPHPASRLNRTIVGLKCDYSSVGQELPARLNRTIVGLKCRSMLPAGLLAAGFESNYCRIEIKGGVNRPQLHLRLNRTIVGLKSFFSFMTMVAGTASLNRTIVGLKFISWCRRRCRRRV